MKVPYILLVDDNKSIRECLTWVLDEEGYAIATASNGEEALTFLEKISLLPSLILLDVMMPIMNGWQFLEKKRLNLRLNKIPVLISTAKINLEDRLFQANEYFLPKPFDIEELVALIKDKSAKSDKPKSA